MQFPAHAEGTGVHAAQAQATAGILDCRACGMTRAVVADGDAQRSIRHARVHPYFTRLGVFECVGYCLVEDGAQMHARMGRQLPQGGQGRGNVP